MKFTVHYTFEDFCEFYLPKPFWHDLSFASKTVLSVTALVGVSFIFMPLVLDILYDRSIKNHTDTYIATYQAYLIIALFGAVTYPYSKPNLRARFAESQELRVPIEFEINTEGITTKSKYGRADYPWIPGFYKFELNAKGLSLYRSRASMIYIPKREVTSENWAKLVELVASKIPSALLT